MVYFLNVPEIVELSDKLEMAVRKRFKELCKMDADAIANQLFAEMSPEMVCSDIDEAIKNVEDLIYKDANFGIEYVFSNRVIAFAMPEEDVNWNAIAKRVQERASDIPYYKSLTPVRQEYAYEAWVVGIKNALKKILEERCEKYKVQGWLI